MLALPAAAVAKDNGHAKHGNGKHKYEHSDRGDYGQRVRHGCPPGLAKKHNGCLPPGQARRIGQRSPWNNDRYVDYNSLPSYYRDRYPYSSGQQYYYEGNRVYTVDPTTQLIRNIVNVLR